MRLIGHFKLNVGVSVSFHSFVSLLALRRTASLSRMYFPLSCGYRKLRDWLDGYIRFPKRLHSECINTQIDSLYVAHNIHTIKYSGSYVSDLDIVRSMIVKNSRRKGIRNS